MPNDYSPNSASRKKAKSLNAQDANVLLLSSLAVVVPWMYPKQINQVQKVLDAAVVNPVVKKEADDLYRRSITHRAGGLVMRDPGTERQAERAEEGMIWVKEEDKRIRLDFEKLLGKDVLEPITDNPDEAEYLKKVKNTLKEKGVWLRVGQERLNDPRSFVVWLSLGYDGDALPTDIGFLDRQAILGNQLLGARYYEEVTQGKVKKTLETLIYRMELDIEDGEKEHSRLIRRYEEAFPGVAELSDAVGGADLPGRSIWSYSKRLMSDARDANRNGNVLGTQGFLLLAAIAINNAALQLSRYAEKSSEGAASVVKVLEVAQTAGEIAVDGLMVTGVALIARDVAVRLTARGLVGRTAAKESYNDVARDFINQSLARSKDKNEALLREIARLNQSSGSGGSAGSTVLGSGIKPNQSPGAGTGWGSW